MTGRKTGVVVRLREHVPNLIGTHCAAHRCALATSQAAKYIPEIAQYSRTVGNVFYYFSASALRSNKLREIQTRVSGETGALLVYSCLITYKRFSQRYQVNMMIYKGVIVNKSLSSYRLNVCSLNVSDGNYLKTVKDTQNLRPQYRKPSRRGFQIISYMFNLNVKLPLANQICCTPYMCIIT